MAAGKAISLQLSPVTRQSTEAEARHRRQIHLVWTYVTSSLWSASTVAAAMTAFVSLMCKIFPAAHLEVLGELGSPTS